MPSGDATLDQNGARFVRDLRECYTRVGAALTASTPVFINRLGGSDTDPLLAYLRASRQGDEAEALAAMRRSVPTLEAYNGYYDKAGRDDVLRAFCERMIAGYLGSHEVFFAGGPLLTQFFPDQINPQFQVDLAARAETQQFFVDMVSGPGRDVSVYPYSFVEQIVAGPHTLFRLFAEILPGRRVLAVTPFRQSIESQFARRRDFFRNYNYPDFALTCYETPITYAGLPAAFYPHTNWLETADAMADDIGQLDFDIALLACGSYAVPLGHHIATALGRKAIYVGGVLQLFFGIMGRRYDDCFFTDQIRRGVFIHPHEAERFLPFAHVKAGTAAEAFGAYL